ncbi:hypothetical protein RFI_20114 [Reticulomyxa filosa]|uniref:TOG domain-containing protein n=1 Tax=Reticulomyxa filosa TaxID=46433 RepID=X6MVT6_RETFI|nr:hypothetical protein RFI_20114 [Reticulomyxa filosa]|eukprot:ETO17215.1 hypothetical protein RFI_20114 [Reticulomyxa filosa]
MGTGTGTGTGMGIRAKRGQSKQVEAEMEREREREADVGANEMTGTQGPAGNENEEGPEPLKASVRKDVENLIEAFGEYTVQCLYSQNWAFREQGLQRIREVIDPKNKGKNSNNDSNESVRLKLTCKVLYKILKDKVTSVFLSGIDVLELLLQACFEGKEEEEETQASYQMEEWNKSMYGLIIELVNALGHSNLRVVDASGSMLIRLSHCHSSFARSVIGELCKSMKRKLPKHLKGRGVVLLELIHEHMEDDTHKENQHAQWINIGTCMELIKAQLQDKNGDVRDIGVQLTTCLYQIHGNKVLPFLSDLNDFLKETLNQSFQNSTGQKSVLQRVPKSQKEQTRPSKAMSKPSPATSTSAAKSKPISKRQPKARTKSQPQSQLQPQSQSQSQLQSSAPFLSKQGGVSQNSPSHKNSSLVVLVFKK